jgi:hypothetical protein
MANHVDQRTLDYHHVQAEFARQAFVGGLTPDVAARDWHEALRQAAVAVGACLAATSNLTNVSLGVAASGEHIWALRHLLAPPASQDRFALICPQYQKAAENKRTMVQAARADAIAAAFALWRNRDLTKWIDAGRPATALDAAAVVAAASPLMASQQVNTIQRNRFADEQEQQVVDLLHSKGWTRLQSQNITTLTTLPAKHFMRKTRFATQQRPQEVDIACGLGQTVVCAMECKVTNDETNSIKRVNDILKKAKAWQDHWGSFVRTVALLKGVVRFRDVERLLTSNVHVFWSHDLGRFGEWIDLPA